jgi:hypothetical protein
VGYVGSGGGAGSQQGFVGQGKTMVDPVVDTEAPIRPWAFECPYGFVVDPSRTTENPSCPARASPLCNSGPTAMDAGKCNSMRLWRYSAKDLESDKRAAYYNPKFPWIQGVWMWLNGRNPWPRQFDIGRMTFPTHLGITGPHVIHWMWRGYRDAIDVDILPASLPVANTSGAMYGYKGSTTDSWIRIDHAQVPKGKYSLYKHSKSNCNNGRPFYNQQTCFVLPPEGQVVSHPRSGGVWSRSKAFQKCKARCLSTAFSKCVTQLPAHTEDDCSMQLNGMHARIPFSQVPRCASGAARSTARCVVQYD